MHVDQIVKAIVEQDLRVEQIDEERAQEHLEHFFVQQKVDRTDRLRICAGEIEYRLATLAPHAAGNLVRSHAHAVVIEVILEVLALFGDDHVDDGTHCPSVAIKHLGHGGNVVVHAETIGNLVYAPLGQSQRRHNRVEVSPVPVRHARVAQQ